MLKRTLWLSASLFLLHNVSHATPDSVELDEQALNKKIVQETLKLDEAFDEPELLAELDLDDLATFDEPLEDDS